MDEFGRRLGWGWLVVGLLVTLGISAFMIAHFGFGEPVHVKGTDRLATDGEVLRNGLFIGGGGLFFTLMGWGLVSRKRQR